MRKIEPIAYAQDSFLQWKPRQSEKVDKVVRTKQEMYGFCTPLYTREALEAAVEAMKRECMFAAKEWATMHVEVDHAPHGVDDEISKYVSVHEVLENILGE